MVDKILCAAYVADLSCHDFFCIFFVGLMFTFVPITIVANVFVIAGPIVTHHLRSSSNVYIVLMAVFDLLAGFTLMPLQAFGHAMHVVDGEVYFNKTATRCQVFLIAHFPNFVSFTLLVLMTIDRSVAINCPFFYEMHCTPQTLPRLANLN